MNNGTATSLEGTLKKSVVLFVLFFAIASISFAGTIQLPQTGQTKCYDSLGNEIDCAGSGQDGEIRAGVAWPNPRFTDNTDGTITDNLTGLMWAKDAGTPSFETCSSGFKTWQSALDYVACLNSNSYLGYSDWRVPNIVEIDSLINPDVSDSVAWLESQGFINVWLMSNNNIDYSSYVSSTSLPGSPTNSTWHIILDGHIVPGTKYAIGYRVWPVRSGQSGTDGPAYPANIWKTGQLTSFYTGDDGDLEMGINWPVPRFTDNNDGTVTDNLTGLTWLKNANCYGFKTWDQAFLEINTLSSGHCGLTDASQPGDWRMPNRKELQSLLDFSTYYPSLPTNHPFINVDNSYWSSTSYINYASQAWAVHIWGGGSIFTSQKYSLFPIWPVRGTTFTLDIDIYPPDRGTVSGPGIDCGSDCEETYDQGTEVTLTAKAEPGWEFAYWDDGEACYTYEKLTVLMDKSKTITALFSIPPKIDGSFPIGGINDGSGVVNGKWTGQPDWAQNNASNDYLDYYAIESRNNNYYWKIYGSGFGDDPGEIYFSNSQITYELQSWSDSLIVIVPKTPYTFEYDTDVVLEIVNSYGLSDTINISVVGLIQSRGFGQCTWFVASTLLAQDKTIPPKAYSTNGTIDGSYEPEQWDALTFGDAHVAIITSGITKEEQTKGKNTVITYTFTVEEMNARWDELPSSMDGSLVIKIGRNGYEHIMKNRMSDTKMKATGYFRTE